jgi:hypothetical protein
MAGASSVWDGIEIFCTLDDAKNRQKAASRLLFGGG